MPLTKTREDGSYVVTLIAITARKHVQPRVESLFRHSWLVAEPV